MGPTLTYVRIECLTGQRGDTAKEVDIQSPIDEQVKPRGRAVDLNHEAGAVVYPD